MSSAKKLRAKYSGTLKFHWTWSVFLALSLLLLDGILLWQDKRSGTIACIFSAAYFLAILWIYFFYRPKILRELVDFATSYGQVQKEILQQFEIPAALLEPDGHVLWMNDHMQKLTGRNSKFHKNIESLFPEISRAALPVTTDEQDVDTVYADKKFRAHIQKISMNELVEDASMVEGIGDANYLYMVYLFDVTELKKYIQAYHDEKPVVGLVYIDNYDEVIDRTDEVHQSLFNVLVERRVNKYFAAVDGLVKKLEKDKFLVLCDNKSLDSMKTDRFSILDGVKTINVSGDAAMTISIGIGVNGKDYPDNYEAARSAIDMALGRGGDQAVIKDGNDIRFYGGKTQHSERNTRVKARVKAQALRDMMLTRDNVVAMGHQMTDMDSFGACVGICRAAATIGKPAHIVLGAPNANIAYWLKTFRESKDYNPDLFITHEQAMKMVNDNTVVVVLDTNRPGMVECREILDQTSSIVVFDHHRQATDTIEKASLSYIEPSASSACEMVAEILQYFEENVRIRSLEADCMYAGIIIDTDSFNAKTGVRTFEAAAYLRRCGADVTRVRKALRSDMESYRAKADCVRSAEKYMDSYAISICRGENLPNPSVTGAKAANELLNIVGVKASFVVTQLSDKTFISARSIDEVNVQLVCERLGGGGHLNIAGAQLTGVTAEEAVQKVKDALKQMTEEGAL